MRLHQTENNWQLRDQRLLLAEYSEGANPRALIANRQTAKTAVTPALIRSVDARRVTNSIEFDTWRHWGINE